MTTAIAPNSHEIMLAGPVGSLAAYIHAVGAIPVLSKEEEQALARRFHDAADPALHICRKSAELHPVIRQVRPHHRRGARTVLA